MAKTAFLFSLSLLLLTVGGHKDSDYTASIFVNEEDVHEVAHSISVADKWVKDNIVDGKIPRNVVVGGGFLCDANYEEEWGLILPAIQNLYFALGRRGLEKKTRVSTIVSTACLEYPHHPPSSKFKEALADTHLKPLLNFLQNTNSSYLLNPSSFLSLSAHRSALRYMGLSLGIDLVKESRSRSRKLIVESLPARPSPIAEVTPSPLYPNIGASVPANVVKNPSPPALPSASPPAFSFTFAPDNGDPLNFPTYPPSPAPAPPSDDFGLPPCGPVNKEPKPARKYGQWCVAKPTVPEDTLQEAMDYACGDGGADCEDIMPHGSCFYPNTVAAHASYAFNSYWQKAKDNGGTCDFGGTAMLINSDPSFFHCHYVLS
ncbi:glucan endo-1,3-beta-glucosidase 13 [Nymphaea colorata]|nr:glucan endo-1,3-beta-glucosidase 13 [Nymphaea colorata]